MPPINSLLVVGGEDTAHGARPGLVSHQPGKINLVMALEKNQIENSFIYLFTMKEK